MGKIVLGIDFGSDSVRCVAVDAVSGKEVSTATVEYPRWKAQLFSDAAEGRYRQHPLDYIESLEKCVRNTLAGAGDAARDVVGLAFDTTASTPVLTDRKGTPLALLDKYRDNPDAMFILWKDHTAIAEADRINEVAHSNCPDYTSFSGGTYSCEWVWAKMLHCLKSSPELKEDVWSWVEHGDWIAGLLTGNTDPGTMARSRCIAGHKAMWNAKWGGLPTEGFLHEVDPELDIFKGHLFRDTVTCDRKVGGLTREWAERLGLPEGIAVGVGAIDCHVGAVGAGITPGNLVKVMGTSTCDIAIATYEEVGDRLLKGICGQVDGSVVPGKIGFEAGQSAFGDIYAWFSRFTGKGIPELTAEAEKLPLTMDDPVSLDWMNGRRTPDADPRVKGLISGLTLGTTPGMVFKSLVEATAFGSRAINERFIQEGVPIEEIIAVGGISRKSPFVMQTMADVLGMPIKVLDSDNACALGAAMFASVAAGIHPDVETAQKHMTPGICALYEPDAARHGIYDRRYALYKALA
ncbi:MAG: ribulokinase [Bacteroidales bacterium]|nr:ribulokinase [Bacteroidales bacterium]